MANDPIKPGETESGEAAIIEAARANAQVQKLSDGSEIIVVPKGGDVRTVGKPPHDKLPTRLIAQRTFHDGDSFARYVGRYKQAGSQLIADIKTNRVTAVLDYPDETQAAFAANGKTPVGIPSRAHT